MDETYLHRDIFRELITFCDVNTVLAFRATCREMFLLCSSNEIWKKFIEKYPKTHSSNLISAWATLNRKKNKKKFRDVQSQISNLLMICEKDPKASSLYQPAIKLLWNECFIFFKLLPDVAVMKYISLNFMFRQYFKTCRPLIAEEDWITLQRTTPWEILTDQYYLTSAPPLQLNRWSGISGLKVPHMYQYSQTLQKLQNNFHKWMNKSDHHTHVTHLKDARLENKRKKEFNRYIKQKVKRLKYSKTNKVGPNKIDPDEYKSE